MQLRAWRILSAALVLAFGLTAAHAADDKKGEVVKVGDVKGPVPAEWKKEKPRNTFRQAQFKLARADGDTMDAEVFVSDQVIGKSDDDIFKRWKKLFVPPQGQTVDDIAKVETVKADKVTLVYLDMQGVYLEKEKPIDPDFKATKRPGYRMVRVLVKSKDDVNYVSLIGPAATVEKNKKAFDEWLKGLK
jgi:hypothetical protein